MIEITELLRALYDITNIALLFYYIAQGGIIDIVLCGIVQNGISVCKALIAVHGTNKHLLNNYLEFVTLFLS